MARQSLNQVRSTIIGVGGFGLHTIGHFAPRLRFLNNQRLLADRTLPDLDRLVSYAALAPRRTALEGDPWQPGLHLWLPRRQSLPRVGPMTTQELWRAVDDLIHEQMMGDTPPETRNPARQALDAALAAWRAANPDYDSEFFLGQVVNDAFVRYLAGEFRSVAHSPFSAGGAPVGRRDVLRSLMTAANPFGTQLEYQLSLAYQDLVQPLEDQTEVTIYVIGSVCDDLSSALFWPLGQLLRQRLKDYEVEIVGLLSTGPYSPPPFRAYEEASAYAGLYELDALSRGSDDSLRNDPIIQEYPLLRQAFGSPAFDRCYLLDAVKASRATAGSEREVVISVANALELFIAGNGDLIVQDQLAAGLSLDRYSTYSALGAAVKFLPIQKIQYWVTAQLGAEIARDHLLTDEGDDTLLREAHARGRGFATESHLTLEGIGRILTASVPLSPAADGQGERLPTYRLANPALLLPPALRPGGPRHRRPSLLAWYQAVNSYRQELVRFEGGQGPEQEALGQEAAETEVSQQLSLWRLLMHIDAGVAQEIDVPAAGANAVGDLFFVNTAEDESVWLTSEPAAGGAQVVAVRAIPYREGYLGQPITEVRRRTNVSFRRLQGEKDLGLTETPTFMGRLRNRLIEQALNEVTGHNKGLPLAQAWLRGVLAGVHEQLERLPHDNREQLAFNQTWLESHIALEQTLGGRPGPDGQPETRGLAQRRPEPAALVARALVAALASLFLVFGFIQRSQAIVLTNWQAAAVGLAIVVAAVAPGVALWLAHRLQDDRFRQRAAALFAEQVNTFAGRAVVSAAEETLNQAYALVSYLIQGVGGDVRQAESWRDANLDQHEPSSDELSDTILRQAIGEEELFKSVGEANREGRDDELSRINANSNLWRWPNPPAQQTVRDALLAYVAAGEGAAQAARAAARAAGPAEDGDGQEAAEPVGGPPPSAIWPWLQSTVEGLAGRFVNQQIPYKQNIETYIAKHPQMVAPGGGDNGQEPPVGEAPGPQDYLIDMGYLAKPYIFLEEAELSQPIVSINLLGVDREERTRFDRYFLADLRPDARWSTHPPRLVTTRDPFSITYLRTLHGLTPESMSRWSRYRSAFIHLAQADRVLLEVLADYRAGSEPENKALFFREDVLVEEDDEPQTEQAPAAGEEPPA